MCCTPSISIIAQSAYMAVILPLEMRHRDWSAGLVGNDLAIDGRADIQTGSRRPPLRRSCGLRDAGRDGVRDAAAGGLRDPSIEMTGYPA